MQLNEIHNPHEHASVSLKAILLVFSVILIGTLGYLVWDYQNTPDPVDYNATPSVKKEASSETSNIVANNTVDCGDEIYAFELTFSDDWEGYKIKEAKPAEAVIYCYFEVASDDKDAQAASSTNDAGYVSLFSVGVYTPAQWALVDVPEGNPPAELDHNANYYWAWSPAQWYPDALKPVSDDVKNVVATFKIAP